MPSIMHAATPPSSPAARPIRFGFATAPLMFLEQNPLAGIVVKDVLGFNAPKILCTRTSDERLDVATLELSNTAITLGSSLVLPPLLRYPASWISGVAREDLLGRVAANAPGKVKLARMAASFGFLFPFAAAFWAAAFFRNYMTAKRSQTANFEQIIGLNGADAYHRHRSLGEELEYQSGMAQKTLGVGVGLGLASLLGFGLAARWGSKATLGRGMEWLFKTFHLVGDGAKESMNRFSRLLLGKGANQVTDGLSTFIFWLAPAYLGWLHAARGKNEFTEQAIKAANAVLWFSLFTPFVVNPLFKGAFKKLTGLDGIPSYENIVTRPEFARIREPLLNLKNKQFGWGLLITIIMLGVTPQLLNIFLTYRRHERHKASMASQNVQPDILRRMPPAEGPRIHIRPDSPFQAFQANRSGSYSHQYR